MIVPHCTPYWKSFFAIFIFYAVWALTLNKRAFTGAYSMMSIISNDIESKYSMTRSIARSFCDSRVSCSLILVIRAIYPSVTGLIELCISELGARVKKGRLTSWVMVYLHAAPRIRSLHPQSLRQLRGRCITMTIPDNTACLETR